MRNVLIKIFLFTPTSLYFRKVLLAFALLIKRNEIKIAINFKKYYTQRENISLVRIPTIKITNSK